jgi:hypothetical protein
MIDLFRFAARLTIAGSLVIAAAGETNAAQARSGVAGVNTARPTATSAVRYRAYTAQPYYYNYGSSYNPTWNSWDYSYWSYPRYSYGDYSYWSYPGYSYWGYPGYGYGYGW